MTLAPTKFIPTPYLELLRSLQSEHGWTSAKPYSRQIREKFPNIPTSTRTRWVRAFMSGDAHDETPSWHTRTPEPISMIPRQFSAIRSGRYKEEREKWKADGQIRYVNWSCWHRPYGDGALLSLAMQMVEDFKPNVVPVMSDFLHMQRFKQHPSKPHELYDPPELPKKNKYNELFDLTKESIDMVKSVVPDSCSLLNLLGNHEVWVLRHLMNTTIPTDDTDLADWIINGYFSLLEERDVLWCEIDQRTYIPLTEHFWVTHGKLTRSGEGGTAKAYLNKMKGGVSLAVGHTHRMEHLSMTGPREEHFAAVAGTLGPKRWGYTGSDFMAHTWGLQFITHPFEGWKGYSIEPVPIHYDKGYYSAVFRGKSYTEKATFEYDDLLDLVETGAG